MLLATGVGFNLSPLCRVFYCPWILTSHMSLSVCHWLIIKMATFLGVIGHYIKSICCAFSRQSQAIYQLAPTAALLGSSAGRLESSGSGWGSSPSPAPNTWHFPALCWDVRNAVSGLNKRMSPLHLRTSSTLSRTLHCIGTPFPLLSLSLPRKGCRNKKTNKNPTTGRR
jgi:hypothetical protein